MKKVFLSIIVTIGVYLIVPIPVSAHVLKTNGTVGAVMHVDPDDDPMAGSPSTIYFDFKDTKEHISPKQCQCTLSIFQKGKEIYSQDLFENTANQNFTTEAVYTFPTIGEYTLKVRGTPYIKGDFQPFLLTYDIDVDQKSQKPSPDSQSQWFPRIYTGVILVLSTALIIFFIVRFKKKVASIK